MEAQECQRRGGGRQRGGHFRRQDSSASVVISAAAHYTDPAEDIIDVLFRYRDSTGIHMTFSLRVTLERITLERTSPLPRPGSPHKLDSPEHSSTSSPPQTLRHGRHQQAASGNSGGGGGSRLCHSLQNVAARSSAAAEAALPRQSSHDESSECEEIQRIHGRLHNAEDEPSDDVDSAIGDIVSAQRDRSTRRVLSMGFHLASIRGGHLS